MVLIQLKLQRSGPDRETHFAQASGHGSTQRRSVRHNLLVKLALGVVQFFAESLLLFRLSQSITP